MTSQNNMSTLPPSEYAFQWCNTLIGEASECRRGVDFATAHLDKQKSSAGQVIQDCTNSATVDGFSTSDAFRYGCYLNAAFQGPQPNLCMLSQNVLVNNGINSNIQNNNFNLPCADTCRTVYNSSDQNLDVCMTSAQYQFNQSVHNKRCSDPTELLSCIDGLYKSGAGLNCEQNPDDMNKICKPSVIGCVLGTLQSGFLNQIQSYQQNNNLPITPCVNYLSNNNLQVDPLNPSPINPSPSNPPPPSLSNPPPSLNNPPNDNWNPWPEGSTY